ncbi:MAG: DUF2155 domain-containing protein [Alphaproteobacteria bacterium]|nr:DUF2155 domain-containing protein [Alphaproteobacteria bacterium]MBQ8660501.1 DUF2155 domain-containing protein [Alphaproteobacteria bacterium]
MKKIVYLFAIFLFASNIANAFTNLPQNKALIRALNKQTGKTKDIEIPVGEEQMFENILIKVFSCYTRPEDETPENSAFLKVNETNTSFKEELNSVSKGKVIFSGWMFSSSPSLVAMEHPNYDIWLLECKNDPNLPKIELPQPETNKPEEENAI